MQKTSEASLKDLECCMNHFFTPLSRLLGYAWLEIIKNNEVLSKLPNTRKDVFNDLAESFLDKVRENSDLLAKENAYITEDESYVRYCDTPYMLRFKSDPLIVAHVPHTLYMYSNPLMVSRILKRIEEHLGIDDFNSIKAEIDVPQDDATKKMGTIDAKTFLSWLLEEGRTIPFNLTERDVLIIKTVGFLPNFEKSITLNNGQRILRLLGLEKNTGQFNRTLATLNKHSIWRAKFNVNSSLLGFQTFYLPPMPANEYKNLTRDFPVLEQSYVMKLFGKNDRVVARNANSLLSIPEENHVQGIIQVPIYSPLIELLQELNAPVMKTVRITTALQYLHVGINEARYPIVFDLDMIYEPTSALEFTLTPMWEETTTLSDNAVKLLQYFADSTNPMTTFSQISEKTGIHRVSIPRIMNILVARDFLYYFPLFTRIGMDNRSIAIFASDDQYYLKAIRSSLARVPRCVTFLSDTVLFAYLSIGELQHKYILGQLGDLPDEIDYYLVPRASFIDDYSFTHNPSLHEMTWTRRDDDLIIFEDYL